MRGDRGGLSRPMREIRAEYCEEKDKRVLALVYWSTLVINKLLIPNRSSFLALPPNPEDQDEKSQEDDGYPRDGHLLLVYCMDRQRGSRGHGTII